MLGRRKAIAQLDECFERHAQHLARRGHLTLVGESGGEQLYVLTRMQQHRLAHRKIILMQRPAGLRENKRGIGGLAFTPFENSRQFGTN